MVTGTQVDDAHINDAQSLKPFARSLSHELRTPMHGVIGMLDVMHATVQEAIESQQNYKIRDIFQVLKENIEVVQGSTPAATSPDVDIDWDQTVLDERLRPLTILSMPMN